MINEALSVPQLFGYATFVCAMITFSCKQDRRFKVWLTVQNILYGVHFFLMGNPAAVAGMVLSALRNILSLRTNALWVAVVLLLANVLVGGFVVSSFWHILPLVGTAVATISMFRLRGMKLRIGMLITTFFWIANNILTGSIGGTAMECTIAVVNSLTIYRLYRDMKLLKRQV